MGQGQVLSRYAGRFVRIIVPIGILAWLFYRLLAQHPTDFVALWEREKNLWRIAAAFAVYLAAVVLTFMRWFLLVRALRLPFRVIDALRLGFVGFVLQFVSLGAVGGDLFKALFIAREQPTRKVEAAATVFIDRVVGMLGLLILAAGVLVMRRDAPELSAYATLTAVVCAGAVTGTVLTVLLLYTPFSLVGLLSPLRRFRTLRIVVSRIEMGIKLYREQRTQVVAAVLLSVITHLLHAAAIYLAATALFPNGPSLGEQIVLWAVAGTVGALPIAPGGLGTFELTYQWLYEQLAATTEANEGILVALLYRVMNLFTAAVGVVVYLSSRQDLDDILRARTAGENRPPTVSLK